MIRWTDKQKMTVDRKVNDSGHQIKSGITTKKFFPTAHCAQSKSVAVAADTQALAHATPTHLLSPTHYRVQITTDHDKNQDSHR